MTIRIESQKLKRFINTVTLGGDSSASKNEGTTTVKSNSTINEIVLNFKENELIINCQNSNQIRAALGTLKSTAFESFEGEVPEKVGVTNAHLLIRILESFNGIINMEIDKNLLTIYNDKKVVDINLCKPEFLNDLDANLIKDTSIFKPIFENDKGVNLKSKIFKNAIKNANILNSDDITISIKNNILEVTTGDNNSNKITK